MHPELIDHDAALRDLARDLAGRSWIALDTEFLRERTYYAQLCLIQIGTGDLAVGIDPLAGLDLGPLFDVLYQPAIVKVLHAARQDLEVFTDLRGTPPPNIFDTQIAAALLGHDDQIGYAPLVAAITGVTLAKGETRTDWSRRPLSDAQWQYALDDVRYLPPLHDTLREQLAARGRHDWPAEDFARLSDPALYRNDPAQAWQRVKGGAGLSPERQPVLRALAAWREQEAQTRNLPRGWVLKDDVMLDIARRLPRTEADLAGFVDWKPQTLARRAPMISAAIDAGLAEGPQQLWAAHAPPSPEETRRQRDLMSLVRETAAREQVAPALLATRRDIERLMSGARDGRVLGGWRRDLIGEALLARLA
jgi:ribonuclease D